MKTVICSELYKMKIRRKQKGVFWVTLLLVLFFCIYSLCYKNVEITEFIYFYMQKLFALLISLEIFYNYFFQEEYQYGTQKNLVWIELDKKKLFLGKFIVQWITVSVNYVLLSLVLLMFVLPEVKSADEVTEMLCVLGAFYFVIVRSMVLFDFLTIQWKNDYITFILYWCVVNFAGLLIAVPEWLLRMDMGISEYTIQGQLSYVFLCAMEGMGYVKNIVVNVLCSLIGLLFCLVLYARTDKLLN